MIFMLRKPTAIRIALIRTDRAISSLFMKTIFITLFEGVETKNILRTDVFAALRRAPDMRLIFLVRNSARKEYLEKEFNGADIHYEIMPLVVPRGWDRFFTRLKFLLLRTETSTIRRRMIARSTGAFSAYAIASFLQILLARPLARHAARLLDAALVHTAYYVEYFDRWRPDLVLAANLFDEPETHLAREAMRRGVMTIGLINSWDKVTARCMLRVLPDWMIVFNESIKEDLTRYHDAKQDRIFVGGIPQYDSYFAPPPETREEFFSRIGADPAKRLIVYAPAGEVFTGCDGEWIDFIFRLWREGSFGADTELLVRFPPYDRVDPVALAQYPNLRYDYPGVRFSQKRLTEWDMTGDDVAHLASTLAHMSLLVAHASSISVDAAVAQKPVINIAFDVCRTPGPAGPQQIFYRMTHYRKALETGGIRLVASKKELMTAVRDYLLNPSRDSAGRQRLAMEQCGFLDGRSGERIGNFVLDMLEKTMVR